MKNPRININLTQIRENAERVFENCRNNNISLTGVVKVGAGDIKLAQSFINGGIKSLGDSRLDNIRNLRRSGYQGETVLLRLPQLAEVTEVINYADLSLVSEVVTVKALSEAAVKACKRHGIIVMIDVGDLREGILPDKIKDFFREIVNLPMLDIRGIGTNVGCYGGVLSTISNTEILVELAEELRDYYSLELPLISGGNTATTRLLSDNTLPEGINHLRIGEAILQGTDITNQRIIKDLQQNNFTMTASIIELKDKPSVPTGEVGYDAFGNIPVYEDRGVRKRAILAVGRQDVKLDGLIPVDEGIKVLGASSDHLLVDVTDKKGCLSTGDELEFYLDYGAILRLMTSPYVYKNYIMF
ncbi:MAG: alanine/ornithine racemase family PLP-dependent enzyme [Firmicutes bacterium]|nr:alanine/ornithine racemase family PLP-dependent enzyme [Bacillota bacterium]